jgi:hypothetical protein
MGWFWDKKMSRKKNFVYSHIVPVDIHTVIHSWQPPVGHAFAPCINALTHAVHAGHAINVALARHWW